MMKHKVVLVPFPFDDFSETKMRPAVCLTEKIGEHNHVIIAFISSQLPHTKLSSDIVVEKSHPDFSATGLRVSSVIRVHRMVSIKTSSIIRSLGFIGTDIQSELNQRIKMLFGV